MKRSAPTYNVATAVKVEGVSQEATTLPVVGSITIGSRPHRRRTAQQVHKLKSGCGERSMKTIVVVCTIFFSTLVLAYSFAAQPAVAQGSAAQDDAAATSIQAEQQQPEYSMSVESPLVVVDVLVTDEDGNVLTGLKKGNFRVLDDGKPQIITDFATTDAAITIVILMEYSGIAYDYFAYKAASWSTGFLDYLEQQDWVALVTYDVKPTVRVDFTRSKPAVEQALRSLSYPGFREANMFDAIADTLDRLEEVKGKRSILLITTGVDTFSRMRLDEVFDKLKRSNVTIFCVGIAESEYLMADLRSRTSSIGYLQMKNQLQTFADLTGGFAWFPRFEGELPDLFRSIGGTLSNQYGISFSPPQESRDGKYHKLKVEVIGTDGLPLKVTDRKGKARNVMVYAREGYAAPMASTTAND
jgi:VWFA-related protein